MQHSHRRRAGWLLGAGVTACAAAGVLLALVWFFVAQGRDRSDQWASVFGFVLTWLLVSTTGVRWMLHRARPGADGPAEPALARLRTSVDRTWSREVASRGLLLPRPLALRWRTVWQPGVRVAQAQPAGAGAGGWSGALSDGDSQPAATALVDAFRDSAVRQLVVLGEPGAGKTTLAMLFVVASVTTAGPGEPVAVLLPVAGWAPAATDTLEDWIADRISQEHPQVSAPEVRALLAHRRIVPVLDGLDEIPPARHEVVFTRLEEAAGAGLRMVITSRTAEFERATALLGVLPQAVVVEIEPVRAGDAIAYLTQREAPGSTRWEPVTRALVEDPSGPLAEALSTPLMIALARHVFRAPVSDPGELAELPTAQAITRRLLDRFLPSAFGPHRATAAGRWLAFLARHLPAHPADPDLGWWRLARAVSRPVIHALVAGAATVVGVLVGLLTAILTGRLADAPLVTGVGGAVGLAIGLMAGRHAARTAHAPVPAARRRVWTSAFVSGLGDLYAASGMLSLLGAAVLLAAYAVAKPAAVGMAEAIRDNEPSAPTYPENVALVGFLAFLCFVTVHALSAGRAGAPRRSMPRLRSLPVHLLIGAAVGGAAGAPLAVAGLLHAAGMDPSVGLVLAAVVAGFVAMVVGLGRWLNAPVAADQPAVSPASLLRADRTALLVTVVGAAASTGLLTALVLWSIGMPARGMPTVGLITGAGAAILVLFGSGSAWLSFTAARIWLALRGRLPWRLMAFLDEAYRKGVLRRAGGAYQIRHDIIRNDLVARWEAASGRWPDRRPAAHPGRRRMLGLAAGAAAIAALPATALAMSRRPAPRVTLPGSDCAFHPDGRVIATNTHAGTVRLWDVTSGRPLVTLDDPGSATTTRMRFSRDGRILATIAQVHDRQARLWDTTTGRLIATVAGSSFLVVNGRMLVSSADRSAVLVSDVSTGRRIVSLGGADWVAGFSRMAFSPDGRLLATLHASDPFGVRLWETSTGRVAVRLRTHSSRPGLRFSPDGSTVTTQDPDGGAARLWDASTGEPLATLQTGHEIADLAFAPGGRIVATVDLRDGMVRLWETTSGRLVSALEPVDTIDRVLFSVDGRAVTTVLRGASRARLWHASTGRPIGPLGAFLAIGPTGQVVATAQSDRIRLRDASTGRIRLTLGEQARRVTHAAFSPDGRLVATISAHVFGPGAGRVRLWTTSTGRHVGTLARVRPGVVFGPDGRMLATSAADDRTVQLWDTPSDRPTGKG